MFVGPLHCEALNCVPMPQVLVAPAEDLLAAAALHCDDSDTGLASNGLSTQLQPGLRVS